MFERVGNITENLSARFWNKRRISKAEKNGFIDQYEEELNFISWRSINTRDCVRAYRHRHIECLKH